MEGYKSTFQFEGIALLILHCKTSEHNDEKREKWVDSYFEFNINIFKIRKPQKSPLNLCVWARVCGRGWFLGQISLIRFVRSHIDWGGKRNILYKGVETFS